MELLRGRRLASHGERLRVLPVGNGLRQRRACADGGTSAALRAFQLGDARVGRRQLLLELHEIDTTSGLHQELTDA